MPGVSVYHAGTAMRDGQLVTAGGRVLTVVGRGADFADAIARAYAGVAQISFDGMQYRRDIGRKALGSMNSSCVVKYSVITFGCRVNQADSLGFEEELLARRRVAGRPPRRPTRRRQHLLGDGQRRSGGAADHPPHRARSIPPRGSSSPAATRRGGPTRSRDLPERGPRRCQRRQARGLHSRSALPTVHPVVELTTAERFGDGDGSCGAAIEPGVAGRTAFTLRVQTGCAEPCSYCIIPTTRGRPRSVPIDDVLAEVERVAAAGFKEIALTGVHLGSYGRDLAPRVVADRALLRALVGRSACRRRRTCCFASARSSRWTARPRSSISSRPARCFAPHFHLPLQHASNRMLAAMRRPYTIEYYRRWSIDIRARIPHASIGSDVIVGFPGRDRRRLRAARVVSGASPLTHLHVFPYSDRPGTAAVGDAGQGARRRSSASARAAIREISDAAAAAVPRRRRSGRVHRGADLEDGSLAVTGNY